MFFTHDWWYRTASKSLPDVPDVEKEESLEKGVVVFFHAEAGDEERRESVLKKFVKNTKWIAGKFGTRKVVLHSFNHLSDSKASPDWTHRLLEEVVERLERTGYTVMVTPFGYFNEFRMHVAGESLAKVFKSF
jgi:sugar phosphate isomerase/epimerase